MIRMGILSSALMLAWGFIFFPVCQDRPYLCNSFLNYQTSPFCLSKYLVGNYRNTYFLLVFVFIVVFVILDSFTIRYVSERIGKSLPLTGFERVLLGGCNRGALLSSIAKNLSEGLTKFLIDTRIFLIKYSGVVFVREPWNSELLPMKSDWASENVAREGIPAKRINIQFGDPQKLEFKNELFDVVVSHTTSSLFSNKWVSDQKF